MRLLNKALDAVLSIMPRTLPVGMTAFGKLAERVHGLAGNICTLDDAKFVISTTIVRFGPTTTRKSDLFFINTLRSAASKQIAGAAFQDVKTRQAEALAKQQAEATAPQELAASDGETKTA